MTSGRAALTAHGIAVWDVLRSCRRVGSLDSAVEPDSMVANDFGQLFERHPHITRVFFNGAAAEKNFSRLVARRTGSSLPAAAVDQPRADHALRRQAGGMAGSHHRTSITVRWAFSTPILSSARTPGLQMTAAVTCRTCGGEPRAGARFCDACGAPIAVDTAVGRVQASDGAVR